MQSDRQAWIRERAYQIWVEEGRVDGRHDEHWQRAEAELAEAENSGSRTATARPRRTSAKAPTTGDAQPADAGKSAAKPAKPRARTTPSAKPAPVKAVSPGPRSADKPAS